MKLVVKILLISLAFLAISCDTQQIQSESQKIENKPALFAMDRIPAELSGVDFSNDFDINSMKNQMNYVNVFNGGGVSVADFNNDGLTDIYFTGNLSDNALYLNKGDLKFEDVTEKAGVALSNSWCTASTVVDINSDGWMDLYVCRSYHDEPERRSNVLFVNNQDGTFTDQSADYGIGDTNHSIAAVFFDADNDGDPDLFVGNHPRLLSISIEERYQLWKEPIDEATDRFYINNGDGSFTEKTREAGMINHGWTLGVVAADLNQDGYTDIYVSVDHDEPDRFYLNNGDGTFSQSLEDYFKHTSFSSMGLDAGDINNDGLLDLLVLDMLAPDQFREKTQMGSMNPEKFWDSVDKGWYYQYMRNVLQLNNGIGHFSEIGQMAGIHRTDWSWAVLFFDMDNDGWKDIYITNGYYRDLLDKDYRDNFNEQVIENQDNRDYVFELVDKYAKEAEATKLQNYFFYNNRDLSFENKAKETGLDHTGFSSGAAYADFDNDGDLDLIVNNIDEKASLYRNNSADKGDNHYIRFKLEEVPGKTALGASVIIYNDQGKQYQELSLTKGYQSSVEPYLHFGLGNDELVEKAIVRWPDGNSEVLENIQADQMIVLNPANATKGAAFDRKHAEPIFKNSPEDYGIDFVHKENDFNDYDIQVLLPHKMSQFGPFITKGDVNGDGKEDLYIGGAHNQAGVLYLHQGDSYIRAAIQVFEEDKDFEDMGSAFFDADNDGDLDLYVSSGGNVFSPGSSYYQDRLYLNNGDGNFSRALQSIPQITGSGSCVRPHDFDNDGDIDLFVGGRHNPKRYPSPATSYLLENQNGTFSDVTQEKAPGLANIGMVTDAHWEDLNGDGQDDLLLLGEWMPVTFFIQDNNVFTDKSDIYGPPASEGWWNRIVAADLDNDGDTDFVLGNLGNNYKYQASSEKPFLVYGGDLDENGSYDIVLSWLEDGTPYPVRGRQCSSEQIPEIKKKFPTYEAFGKATLEEVYGEDLSNALNYEVHTFSNSVMWNEGSGRFVLEALPPNAQVSLGNGLLVDDFDNDGNKDIILAGNLYTSEVETGRADAGLGVFLKGDGNGGFTSFTANNTGLVIEGDVKDMTSVELEGGKKLILASKNDGPVQIVSVVSGNLL